MKNNHKGQGTLIKVVSLRFNKRRITFKTVYDD